jgi:hypothetical protein
LALEKVSLLASWVVEEEEYTLTRSNPQ